MLSGVDMSLSICSANRSPAAMRIMPLITLSIIAVWTVFFSSGIFFAPQYRAATTLAPMESPMNRFVMRFISAVLEPTAASALSPANLPTTMISVALKSSWKSPENIIGSVNTIILRSIGPLHISTYFACFISRSLPGNKC